MQLYIVEFVYGITVAATFPSFMAIFTRHIDKNKEGTEWGINMTLDDLGAAAAAAIGGIMVETVGFHAVIMAMSFIGLLSAVMTLPIKPYIRKS
ncbi:MAG: MFS transporter [Patescibacteria group bacterium]|nr:MFS transporter [Patescibacteria group bacterium]